ncbi:GH3 auxin-responsive promoter family protein [Flavobacteriaceae bacterium]|nr:GH3 auxin-responsive promoter family protein [Flavobacteriaceae bacterium]
MPIPIINTVASWLLKKRLHQIEFFLKYPIEVQDELLMGLVVFAKDTEMGKNYDFSSIQNYTDFASRVPITNYEGMEHLIDQSRRGSANLFWPTPIKWFAKSSGTTNAKSKFIPVSQESLEDCHYKSSKDLLSIYLNNNENSQLFTGKSLRLGGSKELYESHGSVFGDLSAILIDNMPFWAEFSSTPSNKVSLMPDWNTKLAAVIEETSKENVTSMAGVPSWMLVLLNELLGTTGNDHLFQVWDQLEVYFHGGVSFSPYKEQFKKLLPRKSFNYYEIYNASEGFFAIQDRNKASDLMLMLDYGIFYEFIPMNAYGKEEEYAIPLSEVTLHTNYAIVITTNAGLWRYKVGDTVRFTSLSPYRIKITGRTRHHINVFGEELIIENAEEALKIVCKKTNAEIIEYTAAPIFMKGKEKGGHEWLIEFRTPPEDLGHFTALLDNALKSLNSDYEAKRYNNMTLNEPIVHKARVGQFHDWLAAKGKLGGQHKIPRLSNSRQYLEELMAP